MMNVISLNKSAIRKEIKQKIKLLSSDEKARQSEIVCKKILNSKIYKDSKNISVFLSLPSEINTSLIIKDILDDSNKFLFVPDIIESSGHNEMKMVRVYSHEDLQTFIPKSLNVLSPPDGKEREDAFNCGGLDLIIVPGVAFDKNNGRLGHGKGYYDRFFDKVKEFSSLNDKKIPKLIAIAFNEQIIDEVPMSGSDHKVDFVLYQLNQKDLDEI